MKEALRTVSAKEVASKFGYYTDEAMLHPVGIQRHGTTRVVMLSLKEYERLLRRDRQVLLVKDLDDETIEAIRNAEPSERSKELGRLLEDPEPADVFYLPISGRASRRRRNKRPERSARGRRDRGNCPENGTQLLVGPSPTSA